jgi:hypothetical protein
VEGLDVICRLSALAVAVLLLGLLAPVAAAASSDLLDSERLWVSDQILDGAHDYSGVVNGSIDCQTDATSSLDLTVSGHAYGDSDGTFTQTISAELDGRTLTRFDVDFEISLDGPSGPATITGSARLDGTSRGQCRIIPLSFADLHYLGASSPSTPDLLLEYAAVVDAGGVQQEVSGFVAASVLLQCYSATVSQEYELFPDGGERRHCPDAESTLTFGMDAPPPPEPPYVPPAPFLVVSNASAGGFGSLEGTTSGAFACGPQSVLDMDVAGNAYGPYPGTFSETVHIALQGDVIQTFEVAFTILSGDTTVTGTAEYPGGTASGHCGLSEGGDPEDGPAYEFYAYGALQYEATIATPEGTTQAAGWASGSVSLYCLGSTAFSQNCESASSGFRWLVPEVVGMDGHAATASSVDGDNPAALGVSNPAGGSVEITRDFSNGSASTYIVLGQGYLIEAANAASVNNPIELTFLLDSSLVYDYEHDQPIDPSSLTVVRNGQPAPACASSSRVANPDPCLFSKAVDSDGNVTLVALTSHASVWNVVSITTASARELKRAALATLDSATVDSKAAKSLARARSAVSDSLAANLWLTDDSLDAKLGGKVFDNEKRAIKELVGKDLATLSFAHDVTERLLDADQALAEAAISQAESAGARSKDLAAARDELSKAEADRAIGNLDRAIDHYKAAWAKAVSAKR